MKTLVAVMGDLHVLCTHAKLPGFGLIYVFECTCVSFSTEGGHRIDRPCEKHAPLGPFKTTPWWEPDASAETIAEMATEQYQSKTCEFCTNDSLV